MNISPTSDEKIMAALAHGSVFLMFFGPVVAVLIWATQRKKSKFVSFHALQAMGYQALVYWLWIAGGILIAVLSFFLVFPLLALMENSRHPELGIFMVQILIFTAIFGLIGIFFLAGIIGGIYCLLGKDFRYPLLGKWLERYLSYAINPESEMDEAHEENWVAGICHATAVLQLWGVVTPLIVWFTQKERSVRLRFQALQAALYQGIFFVLYLLAMALYLALFFGMFFFLFAGAAMSRSGHMPAVAGIVMLIFFGLMMVFWLFFMILMPLYYLLAGFASLRVIGGHDFHYPILGRILEKRMGKTHSLEPAS